VQCKHEIVRCLNHYDTFRKYQCQTCGRVYICDCERELALTLLPHQIEIGREYGTQQRYFVTGFAPNMCASCRGEREEAHPRAAIYGQKGKVERFYWREIFKTYWEHVMDSMHDCGIQVRDIVEFKSRFPEEAREFRRASKEYWQGVHRRAPKYDLKELTEAAFLSEVRVPTRELPAEYAQIKRNGQRIGKWVSRSGELCSAEQIATESYESLGFRVRECERKLISTLVGTLLAPIVQDPNDPRVRPVMRHSTRGWTLEDRDTPLISFLLPEDFGSSEYYKRRSEAFSEWIQRLMVSKNLSKVFEELIGQSTSLRDYLWVNDDDAIDLARTALRIVPKGVILGAVNWAIQHFWNRQPGWPDLFAYKDGEYLFVEVKSPYDRLSAEQMRWFRWAMEEANIPCEICRLRKRASRQSSAPSSEDGGTESDI